MTGRTRCRGMFCGVLTGGGSLSLVSGTRRGCWKPYDVAGGVSD
jgi:hypothetical protein